MATLVADESVDRLIVLHLRAQGHTVSYIAEDAPGIPDDEVLGIARSQSAILLTGDKDFGELVYRQGLHHRGVVLLRLAGISSDRKAAIAGDVLTNHLRAITNAFTVVTKDTIRIRKQ